MVRQLLTHKGSTSGLFSCATCDTNLAKGSELISNNFTGKTGQAILFNKVVNITCGFIYDSMMKTGLHKVRDVTCDTCNVKLGWRYEYTSEKSEQYKVGRVVLERALIKESVT